MRQLLVVCLVVVGCAAADAPSKGGSSPFSFLSKKSKASQAPKPEEAQLPVDVPKAVEIQEISDSSEEVELHWEQDQPPAGAVGSGGSGGTERGPKGEGAGKGYQFRIVRGDPQFRSIWDDERRAAAGAAAFGRGEEGSAGEGVHSGGQSGPVADAEAHEHGRVEHPPGGPSSAGGNSGHPRGFQGVEGHKRARVVRPVSPAAPTPQASNTTRPAAASPPPPPPPPPPQADVPSGDWYDAQWGYGQEDQSHGAAHGYGPQEGGTHHQGHGPPPPMAYGYTPLYGYAVPGSRATHLPPPQQWVVPARPHGQGVYGRPTSAALSMQSMHNLDVDYATKLIDFAPEDDSPLPKLITFSSCLKLMLIAGIGVVGAYSSVNPRTVARPVYSVMFHKNLGLFAASLAGPLVFTIIMYDSRKVNINTFISVLTYAFTWGYLLTFAAEIVGTTVLKLGVFSLLERDAFKLCPDVPVIHLPWVLQDHGYKISRTAGFLGEVAAYCLCAPLVEEVMKVWIPNRLGALGRKRALTPKKQRRGRRNKKGKGEDEDAAAVAAETAAARFEPKHVHTYLTYVVAAATGLKAADNARRVFMYTKPEHRSKLIFAFARGFFPLQELCAALTAMNLARRDILGERVPWWMLFGPAAALHAWANFRGTKPIYKWASSSPWTELQLQAWVFPQNATLAQMLQRGLATLVWASILLKVLAYVIKTYWRLKHAHNSQLRQQFIQQNMGTRIPVNVPRPAVPPH